MTHTVGNWIVGVDPEDHSNSKLSVHTTDEYYVALVDEGENQLANANLIAAAPDLLAALESVASIRSAMIELDEITQDQIRAAISKAKGLTK